MPNAEPGQTTSEFKLTIGGLVMSFVALLVAFGVHLNQEQQNAIFAFMGSVITAISAYAVSRGIRKSGSS